MVVELVDVSLAEAEVTDGAGAKGGGGGLDAVSEDSEDSEDEERGLLRGDAGDASTSAPRRDDPRPPPPTGWRGYVARVPKGEAVMLAATFTFAFQNVVAKTVEEGVPPMQVVFVRSCISGCVTAFTTWRRAAECNAIVREADAETTGEGTRASASSGEDDSRFTIETLLGHRRFWRLCLLRGVAGSIAFSLAYVSLTYLTVGDSVAIFFLNPIFSSLMAIPALGEKPSAVQAVAIGGGLVGTLLIVKPPALFHALGVPLNDDDRRRDHPMDPVGVGVTLFSAFFCAVAMVSIRAIRGRVSALALAVWFHGCSAALGFASVTSAWPLPPVWPTAHEWGLLILISLTSFVGQLSLNYGYSHLPTLTASALYYLLVVWSAALGWGMMGERVDAYGALGAAVICVGGLAPGVHKARVERAARAKRAMNGAGDVS